MSSGHNSGMGEAAWTSAPSIRATAQPLPGREASIPELRRAASGTRTRPHPAARPVPAPSEPAAQRRATPGWVAR